MHQISSSIDSFRLHLTLAHLNLVELFFYVYRIKDKQRLSTSGALALKSQGIILNEPYLDVFYIAYRTDM